MWLKRNIEPSWRARENDPTALLGLSRVYYRKARKEGQYPPDWQKLKDQLETVVTTEESVKGQVLKAGTKNLQENIKLSEAEKALTQNRFREARDLFTQVINEHREDPYALLTLGEQAFNDGDLRAAEQAFSYAKEISEVAPRAEQGLSKITTQRNEAERQIKLGDATVKMPEVADGIISNKHSLPIRKTQAPITDFIPCPMKIDRSEANQAIDNARRFLESADDANPRRKEVESALVRLTRHAGSPNQSKILKKKTSRG